MKGIKKTLVAGALACATLNAAQAECSPWSYGVKAGLSVSSICGIDEKVKFVVGGKEEVENPMFALPFVNGFVYGEYAFTDYIGMELGVGYMQLGGTLCKKDDKSASGNNNNSNNSGSNNSGSKSEPAFKIASHGLCVPLSLCIYPMGREEGEGIFKLFVGTSAYLSMKKVLKFKDTGKDSYEDNPELSKVNLKTFDIGVQGGVGYEFSFGLSLEARYGYHFMNRIETDSTTKPEDQFKTVGNLENFDKVNNRYFMVNVGYNIASLFKA
ncbi:MAG: PorT family protein [Candidatus Cardinium sp.]|nr:PorT family protein [Candidatus Cardinium sp.]